MLMFMKASNALNLLQVAIALQNEKQLDKQRSTA